MIQTRGGGALGLKWVSQADVNRVPGQAGVVCWVDNTERVGGLWVEGGCHELLNLFF